MDNFIFLTEAGKDRGFGHLTRTSAVASYLKKEGFDINFFLDVEDNFTSNNFLDIEITKKNWLKNFSFLDKFSKNSIVFIDSYDADIQFFEYINQKFKNSVVFDDFDRISYKTTAIINPNLAFEITEYKKNNAVIGGGEYVILRNDFFQIRNKVKINDEIKKVLVTFGGNDNHAIVPKILNLFKNEFSNLQPIVVAGNDFYASKLKFAFPEFKIFGKLSADKMAKLMIKTDLAISGAGQTLNELAFLGIPTIAICVGDDQKLDIEIFFRKKFLHNKIFWNDDLKNKIKESLEFFYNLENRKKISRTGKSLISKNGVKNVVNVLKNMENKKCWFLK